MTTHYDDYTAAAKSIIAAVGKKIIIGVPLGIGKPIGLLNALYRLAEQDPTIELTIMTALTLARPDHYSNELEERFVAPLLKRVLGTYVDPLYEKARVAQTLPANINVIEFFLATAKYLHNDYVQQHYINSTYSLAVRDVLHRGVNVVAQQVAHSSLDNDIYSVSSNSDLFYAIVDGLKKSAAHGKKIAIVGEVNGAVPFMYGKDALVPTEVFTHVIDTKQSHDLFGIPHEELTPQDHLIGLYTSFLIPDDSCLQIGIGNLSNTVANALILRQQHPNIYQKIYKDLQAAEKFGTTITETGTLTQFEHGIYASTEMLSDGYMQLYNAGILKKRVYDNIGLQRLLNDKKISENLGLDILDILVDDQLIQTKLTSADVDCLKYFGIFKSEIKFENAQLILKDGTTLPADLTTAPNRQAIINTCLGKTLKNGKIIHAGFYLGTNDFYQHLRELTTEQLHQIDMTAISRTNSLLWNYELLKLQRQHARFINTAMMVTLGGVVISEGLKNMEEVSGVGGQFDFVNMAQSLESARSIINFRSTRETKGGVSSNIIWEYSSFTIPRFLRDIVITEYGIADCRSKTDEEIIQNMLNITDSRFQAGLLSQAKQAGKIAKDYEIPKIFQQNTAEKITAVVKDLQSQGYCEPYPFGTELTEDEQVILRALTVLKYCTAGKLVEMIVKAFFFFESDEKFVGYLTRMKLDKPKTVTDFIYKKLLKFVIYKTSK